MAPTNAPQPPNPKPTKVSFLFFQPYTVKMSKEPFSQDRVKRRMARFGTTPVEQDSVTPPQQPQLEVQEEMAVDQPDLHQPQPQNYRQFQQPRRSNFRPRKQTQQQNRRRGPRY